MFKNFSKILTSKTFATGIISIISGVTIIVKTGDVTAGVQLILTGLGMITLRHGMEKR